jgi:hypothetical protein
MKKNIIFFVIIFLLLKFSHLKAEEWKFVNNDRLAYSSVNGEITYGDNLSFFLFKKDDCETVWTTFSIYTYLSPENLSKLVNKNIPIKLNGLDLEAKIVDIKPFLMGHRYILSLGSYNFIDYKKFIVEFFNEFSKYEIELIDNEKFQSSKYFDIRKNNWILKEVASSLDKTENLCFGVQS